MGSKDDLRALLSSLPSLKGLRILTPQDKVKRYQGRYRASHAQ